MPAITLAQEPIPNGGAIFRMPPLTGGMNLSTNPLDIELNQGVLCINTMFFNRQLQPDFGLGEFKDGALYDSFVETSDLDWGVVDVFSFLLRDGEKLDIIVSASQVADTNGKYRVRFRAVHNKINDFFTLDSPFTGRVYCEYVIWADQIVFGLRGQAEPRAISASGWHQLASDAQADLSALSLGLGNLTGSAQDVTNGDALTESFTAEGALSWNGFLFFWNTDEDDGRHSQRVRWSARGDITEWLDGLSGHVDMLDHTDDILTMRQLNEYIVLYRRHSLIRVEYKGVVNDLFSFQTVVNVDGPSNAGQVTDARSVHFFVGDNGIYGYNGGLETAPVSDNIRHLFLGTRNVEAVRESELVFLYSQNRLIWILGDTQIDNWPARLFHTQFEPGVPVAWSLRRTDDCSDGTAIPDQLLIREYWDQDIYTWETLGDLDISWKESNGTSEMRPTWASYREGDAPERRVAAIDRDGGHLYGYDQLSGYLEQCEWVWQSGGLYLGTGDNWDITGLTVNLPRKTTIQGEIAGRYLAVRDQIDTFGRIRSWNFNAGRTFGRKEWTVLDDPNCPAGDDFIHIDTRNLPPFTVQIRGTPNEAGSYKHQLLLGMAIHLRAKEGRRITGRL